jgi:hypothetical protein
MQQMTFFVPTNRHHKRTGKPLGLDGMNEILHYSGGNRYAGSGRKAENEKHVAKYARAAMEEWDWVCPSVRCVVRLTFVEPNRKRDEDGVFAGAKYILDALCSPESMGLTQKGTERVRHRYGCGAIVDDDPAHVMLTFGQIEVDPEHPGCWVTISEMEVIEDDVL